MPSSPWSLIYREGASILGAQAKKVGNVSTVTDKTLVCYLVCVHYYFFDALTHYKSCIGCRVTLKMR